MSLNWVMTGCHFTILSQNPPEDIKALSWNRQVQHILSSAHPSGKAVVWDLRKNEPIIKVSDHSSRVSSGQNTGLGPGFSLCQTVEAALAQARDPFSSVGSVDSAPKWSSY